MALWDGVYGTAPWHPGSCRYERRRISGSAQDTRAFAVIPGKYLKVSADAENCWATS